MNPSFYIPPPEASFLELQRPIIFFDLETTGIDPLKDRIVELYAVKILADGQQQEMHRLVNPTIPISPGATATHGITDEMVADQPTFAQLAQELSAFFEGCDLGGFNIRRYDLPMLLEEFGRCKKYPINYNEVKVVDAMSIYHNKEKRDLSAAVRFYLQREHDGAHSARADVLATIEILKRQLLLYEDLEANTTFLHDLAGAGASVDPHWRFVRNEEERIVFNFGKHKGEEACTQPGFLEWMLKEEFAVATKMVAKKILMHSRWEKGIREWLQAARLLEHREVAAALYATVTSGEGIYPFSVSRQAGKLTVQYQGPPPSSYTFEHKEAERIMLKVLEGVVREGVKV